MYLSVCANMEAILSGIQAVCGDFNCQGKIFLRLHNAPKIRCTLYFTLLGDFFSKRSLKSMVDL